MNCVKPKRALHLGGNERSIDPHSLNLGGPKKAEDDLEVFHLRLKIAEPHYWLYSAVDWRREQGALQSSRR